MDRKSIWIIGTSCIVVLAVGVAFARYEEPWRQERLRATLPEAQTFEEYTAPAPDEEASFVFPLEREASEDVAPVVVNIAPVIANDSESVIANEREAISLTDQDDATEPTYDSINLAVPFTSQAPHANWSLPYQEACEEASVLMAVDFFDDALADLSTPEAADVEILSLVAFQTERYGDYLDTTAAETVRFASQKYEHILFSLLENPSVADVQAHLRQGHLVIVPAYGRALGNPNFTGDGPLYHMLVLRGFDARRGMFITNDPGTRNGEAYVYREDVLMNAIGDWNNGDPEHGEKVVIVVAPRVR